MKQNGSLSSSYKLFSIAEASRLNGMEKLQGSSLSRLNHNGPNDHWSITQAKKAAKSNSSMFCETPGDDEKNHKDEQKGQVKGTHGPGETKNLSYSVLNGSPGIFWEQTSKVLGVRRESVPFSTMEIKSPSIKGSFGSPHSHHSLHHLGVSPLKAPGPNLSISKKNHAQRTKGPASKEASVEKAQKTKDKTMKINNSNSVLSSGALSSVPSSPSAQKNSCNSPQRNSSSIKMKDKECQNPAHDQHRLAHDPQSKFIDPNQNKFHYQSVALPTGTPQKTSGSSNTLLRSLLNVNNSSSFGDKSSNSNNKTSKNFVQGSNESGLHPTCPSIHGGGASPHQKTKNALSPSQINANAGSKQGRMSSSKIKSQMSPGTKEKVTRRKGSRVSRELNSSDVENALKLPSSNFGRNEGNKESSSIKKETKSEEMRQLVEAFKNFSKDIHKQNDSLMLAKAKTAGSMNHQETPETTNNLSGGEIILMLNRKIDAFSLATKSLISNSSSIEPGITSLSPQNLLGHSAPSIVSAFHFPDSINPVATSSPSVPCSFPEITWISFCIDLIQAIKEIYTRALKQEYSTRLETTFDLENDSFLYDDQLQTAVDRNYDQKTQLTPSGVPNPHFASKGLHLKLAGIPLGDSVSSIPLNYIPGGTKATLEKKIAGLVQENEKLREEIENQVEKDYVFEKLLDFLEKEHGYDLEQLLASLVDEDEKSQSKFMGVEAKSEKSLEARKKKEEKEVLCSEFNLKEPNNESINEDM